MTRDFYTMVIGKSAHELFSSDCFIFLERVKNTRYKSELGNSRWQRNSSVILLACILCASANVRDYTICHRVKWKPREWHPRYARCKCIVTERCLRKIGLPAFGDYPRLCPLIRYMVSSSRHVQRLATIRATVLNTDASFVRSVIARHRKIQLYKYRAHWKNWRFANSKYSHANTKNGPSETMLFVILHLKIVTRNII